MSRAAIFEAIVTSNDLNSLGITRSTVFPNWSLDQKPSVTGPFLILRWADEDDSPFGTVEGPRIVTVWAHYPLEKSNDFTYLDQILDKVDDAILPLGDTDGEDGRIVTEVRKQGRSPDFTDDAFKTISRNASYRVLSRKG